MDYNVQFKMLGLYALKAKEQQKKSQKKWLTNFSLFIIKLHKSKVQIQNWKTIKHDFCKSSAINDSKTHGIGLFSLNMPKGKDANIHLMKEEIYFLNYMKKKIQTYIIK